MVLTGLGCLRGQWVGPVNTVMKFGFVQNVGEILSVELSTTREIPSCLDTR
jgi:hypothetical protein